MSLPTALSARDVKSRADFFFIASKYMRLRRSGRQFVGLCPFHSERHPSCYVHPEKKIFFCFGCQRGGDLFDFVMLAAGCSFPQALRIVSEFSSGVAAESGPRSGPRFRGGVGASPGRTFFVRPHPIASKREVCARSFSPLNRWPSIEDCAAERAFFTCTQRITFAGSASQDRADEVPHGDD